MIADVMDIMMIRPVSSDITEIIEKIMKYHNESLTSFSPISGCLQMHIIMVIVITTVSI